MALVIVIPTYYCLPTTAYLPAFLPACAIALAIKQAVIGRTPKMIGNPIFYGPGGGGEIADILWPSWEAIMVHLWAFLVTPGWA